jgi:hypothetical protein
MEFSLCFLYLPLPDMHTNIHNYEQNKSWDLLLFFCNGNFYLIQTFGFIKNIEHYKNIINHLNKNDLHEHLVLD